MSSRSRRLGEQIVRELAVDDRMLEAMLGDLAEEYDDCRRSHGAAAAHAWYWKAVLASVPSLAMHASRRTEPGRLVRGIGIVAAALVTLALIFNVADAGISTLTNTVGHSRYGALGLTLGIVVGSFGAALVGRLTAAIAPRPLLCSATAALVLLALNVSAAIMGVPQVATWYWLGFGAIAATAMVGGGIAQAVGAGPGHARGRGGK